MRTLLIILCFFFSLTACNDSKKDEASENKQEQNESTSSQDDLDYTLEDQKIKSDSSESEDSESKTDRLENNDQTSNSISGLYVKNDEQEDFNCKCYCIDVNINGTSELCLTEGELYINGRFEQNGNNIGIYYSGKSSGNTDTEIPWDKFETGTPIAVLSPSPNGFKLDWKGFSIDGKIAVDYALYGKKTLEGTYKKK
ncbi:hypothetical protein [Gramella sp. MAR_2010_147]|uniref:hypothetical protein n=1 Tax=Gramella sp. MAR_2010_147 TaxID=1250205 RepID=UPI000879AAEC|nr:hypothetical protein [Gramella sp. MAR_2010_147]SDS61096.1 hypothetical protein SAMN04488553_2659 [Gramella sp. MAR_2010_147]